VQQVVLPCSCPHNHVQRHHDLGLAWEFGEKYHVLVRDQLGRVAHLLLLRDLFPSDLAASRGNCHVADVRLILVTNEYVSAEVGGINTESCLQHTSGGFSLLGSLIGIQARFGRFFELHLLLPSVCGSSTILLVSLVRELFLPRRSLIPERGSCSSRWNCSGWGWCCGSWSCRCCRCRCRLLSTFRASKKAGRGACVHKWPLRPPDFWCG
jgi:hypothetical protein